MNKPFQMFITKPKLGLVNTVHLKTVAWWVFINQGPFSRKYYDRDTFLLKINQTRKGKSYDVVR